MTNNVTETENTQIPAEQQQNDGSAKGTARKAASIVLDVVLYAFLALSIILLVFSLATNKDNGAANIFGYEMRIVTSSSMEKSDYSVDVSEYEIKDLKVKSMIFVERVPEDEEKAKEWYSELEVGDVLTFRYVVDTTDAVRHETVTHRITEIVETENGYIISLQGDNRSEGANVATQTIYTSPDDYPDYHGYYNFVIGKVVGTSVFLGNVVYVVTQPVGIACIVIVPCVIIIVWQIMRVVGVFSEERKKKAAAQLEQAEQLAAAESLERAKQAQELEELKRKLAELEKQQPENGGDDNRDG